MKRRPRKVFTLLLFMLAIGGGAIITVAVAWGFAIWGSAHSGSKPQKGWFPGKDTSSQEVFIVLKFQSMGSTWLTEFTANKALHRNAVEAEIICPYWSDYPDALRKDDSETSANVANGWPLRSLSCRLGVKRHDNGKFESIAHDALRLPDSLPGVARKDVHLPCNPIAVGFAINTLFYAVILWMMFAGPGAIRRKVRARRGLCLQCAYSLRGSASQICPECGAGPRDRGPRDGVPGL